MNLLRSDGALFISSAIEPNNYIVLNRGQSAPYHVGNGSIRSQQSDGVLYDTERFAHGGDVEPENELGVIVLFSQQAVSAGFEIKSISASFPDAVVEKEGKEYRVEFEFAASNFLTHGHDLRKCDLVICWENDCVNDGLPVLAISDPAWKHLAIQSLSDVERELIYWRHRAIRAENALKADRPQIQKSVRPIKGRNRAVAPRTFEDFRRAVSAKEINLSGMTGESIGQWAGMSEATGRRWKRVIGKNGHQG